jgi:hypothetical protein
MPRLRTLALLLFVVLVWEANLPVGAQEPCRFVLGFAALRDLVGVQKVGECLEDEHFNLENGNAEQRTSGGLLVWRKVDNFTAFTDGGTSWINGPNGLQSRPNAERFSWEKDPVQPGSAPQQAAQATPTPRTPGAPAQQVAAATATPTPRSQAVPNLDPIYANATATFAAIHAASTATFQALDARSTATFAAIATQYAPSNQPVATPGSNSSATSCCRRCTTGKPCGDSCISARLTCHKAGGCACYGYVEPELLDREAAAMSDDDIIEEARLLAVLNTEPLTPCDDELAVGADLPSGW